MKRKITHAKEVNISKIEILNDQHLLQIKGGSDYCQNPAGSNDRINKEKK